MIRVWTKPEDAAIRAHYRRGSIAHLSKLINRTASAIYQRASKLGVARRYAPTKSAVFRARVLALHDRAHTSAEIARRLKTSRKTVRNVLRSAGRTPHGKDSPHFRRRAARQMKAITDLGANPFHARWRDASPAIRYGLPAMSEQQLRVLLTLIDGPLTRRQICDAAGFPWKGVRNSLLGHDNSYLANLAQLGLVASITQPGRRGCRGGLPRLYTLTGYAMDLLAKGGA